jgi:hypothetical protein
MTVNDIVAFGAQKCCAVLCVLTQVSIAFEATYMRYHVFRPFEKLLESIYAARNATRNYGVQQ